MPNISPPNTDARAHQAHVKTLDVCIKMLQSYITDCTPEERSTLTHHLVHLDTIKERLHIAQHFELQHLQHLQNIQNIQNIQALHN